MRRASSFILSAALAAGAHAAAAQTVTGTFHNVWQVSQDPRQTVRMVHLLTDDAGRTHRLELDPEAAAAHGGPMGLDRRRVTVRAVDGTRAAGGAPTLRVVEVRSAQGVAALGGQGVLGSRPYVTVLCRFSDHPAVQPHDRDYYDAMLTGTGPLGMDAYWRESSENRVNLGGSQVAGWYDMPSPEAAYYGANPDGTPNYLNPNFNKLTADCAGMANAEVDFSRFVGVNLQFNTRTGNWSWGGAGYINLDGPGRVVPMTWMASWATHATYAHEIGHSFGLPHSSGPYTATYDSRWDVMSGGGGMEGEEVVAVHTIGWHKQLLGWVLDQRTLSPTAGSRSTVTLERGAVPAGAGHLLVRVPLPGSTTRFYTAEARRHTGFDRHVPGEGVVIHSVDQYRGDRAAQVVDPDGNQNPNDAAATWTAGEAFHDSVNGFTLQVDSAEATALRVSVTRGWQLEYGATGGGTVSAAGVVCNAARCWRIMSTRGQVLPVTATPADGWIFHGWTGACTGTDPCSPALSQNRVVTARFVRRVTIVSDSARRAGVMGASFADTLVAEGGDGAIAWRLADGALPAGVTLAAGGTLSGVPAAAGTFRFTAVAAWEGLEASGEFVMTVTKPTLTPAAVLEALLQGQALGLDEARFLDLLGNANGRVDVGDVRAWLLDTDQIEAEAAAPLLELLEAMEGTAPVAGATTDRKEAL